MLDRNIEGYNLIEIDKDIWYLQVVGDTIFSGTFREVIVYAVRQFGFKMKDIDEAIQDMVNNNHNVAHFGMYKSFIYSSFMELVPIRKAS